MKTTGVRGGIERRLNFDKVFVMVFDYDALKAEELYMITIFPGW